MLEEHQKRWGRGVWWAGVVGSLSFDVQGWGEVSPNLDPFGQIEKGRRGWGVQKLDIFHGCHKCVVPK